MSAYLVNIRCYVSPAGNNKIADWYAGLSEAEKADADTFLDIMRKRNATDWKLPDYKWGLQGFSNLGELRWPSANKKHRLIGFFAGGIWYAVLGCTHKQQIYDPADALNTADKRHKQVKNKGVATVEYDL